MKCMNNLDLEIGEQDISISIYSAVEKETSFKQLSNCCDSVVNYKKVCNSCNKELSPDEIHKAIEIGKNEYKSIDEDKVKVENTNLKVLGKIDNNSDKEENGFVRNGTVWFIGIQVDKKNTGKTDRSYTKFAYIREGLKKSNQSLVCAVAVRGKEHLMLVKPFFNGFIGTGLYYFEQLRDINEISGYTLNANLNEETINGIAENLKQKDDVVMKDISNNREQIISDMALSISECETETEEEKEEEVDAKELVNF